MVTEIVRFIQMDALQYKAAAHNATLILKTMEQKWQCCSRRLCPTRLMGNSTLGSQSEYPEYPNWRKS